jgi:hypothetical protein
MSEGTSTSLSVCVRDQVAIVRVIGQAKFRAATDFKNLLLQLQLDSTFLGVMTVMSRKCEAAKKEGKPCSLKLYHPSDRILEALANFEILGSFTIIKDPPEVGAFQRVEESNAPRVEITRTCHEAHKALMETCDENARRFKDATEFFEKNLREEEGKK